MQDLETYEVTAEPEENGIPRGTLVVAMNTEDARST